MASITIRNLDPALKERLRIRAAERGHSMEAEARRILHAALHKSGRSGGGNLYERIHARFSSLGGVNLELPPRRPTRDPPPIRVMFILDTNVLSAMMSADPAPQVVAWVSGQPIEILYTASVCQAEILAGLSIMPAGRRRFDLEAAARAMFLEDFHGRVLSFDMAAAVAYADIFAARRQAGRSTATIDLMIASIARSQGAGVVTRNVADFEECGVAVVNPWDR